MNKVVYLLPTVSSNAITDLRRLSDAVGFFDYEDYEGYWDEKQYKKLRGPITGADRLARGLQRLRLQSLTDISHLPLPEVGHCFYINNRDVTDGLEGRYCAMVNRGEICCLVNLYSQNLPKAASHWVGHEQQRPVAIAPVWVDVKSLHGWFAAKRSPQRKFNYDARKHLPKEYYVDGVGVSPLTLTKAETEEALANAVGSKNNRRLMHYVGSKRIVVIFSLENHPQNGENPVYHGHQISEERKAEFHRLPNDILRKVEALGEVKLR